MCFPIADDSSRYARPSPNPSIIKLTNVAKGFPPEILSLLDVMFCLHLGPMHPMDGLQEALLLLALL